MFVEESSDSDQGDMGAVAGRQMSGNKFTVAQRVIVKRENSDIAKRMKSEARASGESMYYGWGSGKDRVVGPSIRLAQAAARCYGNVAIDMGPVVDQEDAWIFTAYFIDLETGFTYGRQFRQSKSWTVFGKMDEHRKSDIRFQIGQSKAIRNVIINCIPDWIINGAMREAMTGVREKVIKYVNEHGIEKAIEKLVVGFAKHGVVLEDILQKVGVSEAKAIDINMIVMLRGDLYALETGADHATELFPNMSNRTKKVIENAEAKAKADEYNQALEDDEDGDSQDTQVEK